MFRHMDIWSPREPWQSPETNVGPGFRAFKLQSSKRVVCLNSQFSLQKTSQNDDSQSPTSFNTSPTFRKTAAKNTSERVQHESNMVQREPNFWSNCCKKWVEASATLSSVTRFFAKLLQNINPNESNMSPTWSNKSPTFDQTAAKNRSTPVQLEANLVQRKSNFLQVCCRKHGPTRVQLHCRPSHACA